MRQSKVDASSASIENAQIYVQDGSMETMEAFLPTLENEKISLPHDQLLKALYWVYDFMDRALINFFVVGKTAEAVRSKKDLTGDKITVGVRRLEWLSGARRIADSFATPLKEEGNIVEYEFEGVPVILYILDDDSTISSSLNQEIYKSEFFKIPNPYDRFQEVFSWVK